MAAKKLPTNAYVLREGESYVPFTLGQTLTEFTFKAALAGIVLGVVFGAANTSSGEIWNRYVRYIGAGAVATAGIPGELFYRNGEKK